MKSVLSGLLIGAAMFGTAQAEVVTFQYTAVVDRLIRDFVDTPSVTFDGMTLAANNTFTGTFTLDLNSALYNDGPPTSTFQRYSSPGNVASVTFDHTGYTFKTFPAPYMSFVSVFNSTSDSLGLETAVPYPNRNEALSFNLVDRQGTAFSGTSIPATLNFADFEDARMFYFVSPDDGSGNLHAYARLTSLSIAPVPEPATTAMLSLGLLTLGGVAYRRRKQQADDPA